ncbi:ferritin family protein [Desertibaculum subflavum]|uniref:ferritin family protein n=1 Tax=Desertibaculum subflavum TaxID=2268458 RepID=UPI0013C4DED2
MSLLRTEPPEAVRSLEELFAIAHGMEQEAQHRYEALAQKVRAEGVPKLAELFEWLARAERSHVEHVDRWCADRRGKLPDARDIRWDLPQTFDDETAGEFVTSQLADAYRVLSMAVRNEERAFALWTYIASRAETEDIRQAAETMAQEELEHVAILRRARRQAYHAPRSQLATNRPRSPTEALTWAARLERQLADLLEDWAGTLTGGARERALDLAGQARVASPRSAISSPDLRNADKRDILAIAEGLVETYLEVGEHCTDETVLAEAQGLAEQAVARLARLRGVIDRN